MSQFDANEPGGELLSGDFGGAADGVKKSANALGISAASFAKAMTKAFSDATAGGKQFDDVLKQLALRLSNMTVSRAFQPIAKNTFTGLSSLFGDVLGGAGGKNQGRESSNLPYIGEIAGFTPFASGGVIGAPTYFPLMSGGLGLAGEAGPEGIMPLTRGSDGRLGVATTGAGRAPNINVHIATPDPGSFRRSETYITGQIARAVARGQRGL